MTVTAAIAGTIITALFFAEPSPVEADVQDVLLLNPRGPVLVRMHIAHEGGPFQQVWGNTLWSVFERIDGDLNQEITFSEFHQFPLAEFSLRDAATGLDSSQPLSHLDLDRSPRDGVITLDEFLAAVGSNCLRFRPELPPSSSTGDIDPIMTLLDRNKDRLLSLAEGEVAYSQLMQLDYNDDEMLSETESSNRVSTNQIRFINRPTLNLRDHSRVTSFAPVPGAPRDSISKAVKEHYARLPGDRSFNTRPDLLDAPDLELRIVFGKNTPAEKRVQIVNPAQTTFTLSANVDSRWVFEKKGIRFELFVPKEPEGNLSAEITQQFKQLDTDANDYLDPNEFRRQFQDSLFKTVDRDGNNQIHLPELLDYLSSISNIKRSRVDLSIRDIGQAFFDIVDTDQNGFLIPREMKNLSRVMNAWDNNRDFQLASEEIPRIYRAVLSLGTDEESRSNRTSASSGPKNLIRPNLEWFSKMDRNKDGDLTPREFLGPEEAFQRADADHDGLLSASEALLIK